MATFVPNRICSNMLFGHGLFIEDLSYIQVTYILIQYNLPINGNLSTEKNISNLQDFLNAILSFPFLLNMLKYLI